MEKLGEMEKKTWQTCCHIAVEVLSVNKWMTNSAKPSSPRIEEYDYLQDSFVGPRSIKDT